VAASTNKKVLVARFERPPLEGFVQGAEFSGDAFDLLRPDGSLVHVAFAETKAICFVRDFEGRETWRENRAFLNRPKSPGIWVRFVFRDGDSIEGTAPNDLMLMEPAGFSIAPPDPTFQNQRIFVPRGALRAVEVLGVIGSPLKRRTAKKPGVAEEQMKMFHD